MPLPQQRPFVACVDGLAEQRERHSGNDGINQPCACVDGLAEKCHSGNDGINQPCECRNADRGEQDQEKVFLILYFK